MKVFGFITACLLFSTTSWAQTPPESTPQIPDSSTTPSPPVHPSAVTYSDGYLLRAKIHKIASFATLPLFATEVGLGQSLYNNPTNADTKKGLHVAVGTGIIGLFGINSVTGIWNMLEDRHNSNSNGHKLRLVHGLLMLTANAGFVATAATGPHSDHHGGLTFASASNRSLHRDLAFGSMAVGTVGYTLMLFGHK